MKAWNKDVKKISKEFAEMNRNYDLTEAEMEACLKWTDARRDAFRPYVSLSPGFIVVA